jgi:hypothetical protein
VHKAHNNEREPGKASFFFLAPLACSSDHHNSRSFSIEAVLNQIERLVGEPAKLFVKLAEKLRQKGSH